MTRPDTAVTLSAYISLIFNCIVNMQLNSICSFVSFSILLTLCQRLGWGLETGRLIRCCSYAQGAHTPVRGKVMSKQSEDDALSASKVYSKVCRWQWCQWQSPVTRRGGSRGLPDWFGSVVLSVVMASCPLSFNSCMFSKPSW